MVEGLYSSNQATNALASKYLISHLKHLFSMEGNDFLSFLPQVIRPHLIPILLGSLGIIFMVVGLVPVIFPKQKEADVVFESSAASVLDGQQAGGHEPEVAGASTRSPEAVIQVDIAGAVLRPGVYSLPQDGRVKDVIEKAGGFGENVNREWIAKNLNLASKLHDEEKLYVPFEGEDGVKATAVDSTSNSGLTNMNIATESQLDSLPGVGSATAQKIISGRPYQTIDELVTKKIIGQSEFEKIKAKITTN